MISPIDIISYDTRPQEFEAPALPLQGPSFSEHLVRAEDERSRSGYQPDAAASGRDTAPPLNEPESPRPGEESRAGRGETTTEAEAPERAEEAPAPERAEESPREESAQSDKSPPDAEKGAETGDKTGEAADAGERASGDSRRKEAGEAKAADAGQTLLQRKEALAESREAGEEAAEGIALQVPEAAQAEAKILPAAEGVEGEARSGSEAALQSLTESRQAETNALLQPLAKDAPRGNEAAGSGEKGAGRRAGRSGEASAPRGEESRPALELLDLRRTGKGEAEARNSGTGGENGESRSFTAGNQLSAESGQPLRQEVMVLEASGGRNDAGGFKGEALPSRAAEELARALKEGGNNEILKRARITLKEGNQGEIRLILKPERLGEVQIRLNLSDRHIAGRIIVENSSVREVFQENMEALNRAFRESGYQTAGLEVSVGGREGHFGRQKERAGVARSAARGVAMLDEQVPRVHSDLYATSRINVYV